MAVINSDDYDQRNHYLCLFNRNDFNTMPKIIAASICILLFAGINLVALFEIS